MGLASYLQRSFVERVPLGWHCSHEVPLLSNDLEKKLGFAPRADVLLENPALNKRIWIEFEVSRADPAANHMKFAVGHLFAPQILGDSFVSMISDHVAFGRMNLGASAIILMRRLGMQAFQIPLFPNIAGLEIKKLNHLTQIQIAERNLDVELEIERAISISEPVINDHSYRIYFSSNAFEVSLNVWFFEESCGVKRRMHHLSTLNSL